jgi:hypothetical protein
VPATSSSEAQEAEANQNNAAAYNQSIYLMVGMPYLLLGGISYMIYRGVKKNEAYFQARGRGNPSEPRD